MGREKRYARSFSRSGTKKPGTLIIYILSYVWLLLADVEISINILVGSQFDDLKFLNLCMAVVSDESSDDDAGDVEDLREVAKVEDFENFDPRFSKKRFTRLKEVDRKLLSAVLHLSKTELKQKKSNASLTYDRKQWLISCRGLHGLVFNARMPSS